MRKKVPSFLINTKKQIHDKLIICLLSSYFATIEIFFSSWMNKRKQKRWAARCQLFLLNPFTSDLAETISNEITSQNYVNSITSKSLLMSDKRKRYALILYRAQIVYPWNLNWHHAGLSYSFTSKIFLHNIKDNLLFLIKYIQKFKPNHIVKMTYGLLD